MASLDQPPPGYTPMSSAAAAPHHSDAPQQQLQFDIVPRSDATSFQAGYLGLQHQGFQAWVKGDVLLKLDGADSNQQLGPWFKCTITLTATESAGDESILLFTSSQQLWAAPTDAPDAASSSSSAATVPSPPAVMPFSFELTPDLPHCIHLPTSSLVYKLHARLHAASPSEQDTIRSVPVHLTRYTSPGRLATPTSLPAAASSSSSANGAAPSPGPSASSTSTLATASQRSFSAQPHVWHLHHPVPIAIRLRKSLLRRAEPIELHFRIPPPPALLQDGQDGERRGRTYAEKGLRLRSVEADLVRVVRVKGGSVSPEEAAAASTDGERGRQELLLAHSGKLARFHSKRPIQLRLTLHPPFDRSNMPFPHPDHDAALSGPVYGRGGGGGCESISQETLLHDIRFEVRARVGLSGDRGESRDVRISREVWIAPGAIGQGAGASSTDNGGGPSSSTGTGQAPPGEKGQSSKSRQEVEEEEPIDQRAEDGFEGFRSEDEYDGYEDVGRSLLDEGDDDGQGASRNNEEQEALALQAALWPQDAVLDAVSHAEATASYERLTRSSHVRPPYSSEDPAILDGSPPASHPEAHGSTADVPRRSTSLERTPSHHRRRLEQLRVLLEQRERQMYRGGGRAGEAGSGLDTAGAVAPRREEAGDDPPPSLLESQHDLQVEVEVEGVGSAMPRSLGSASGLGAEAFQELSIGGPPAIGTEDDGELPPFDAADLRGYSAREARGGPGSGDGEGDLLPPPPISPPPGHEAVAAELHHGQAHAQPHAHDDAFPPPPPLSPPPPTIASRTGGGRGSRPGSDDLTDEAGPPSLALPRALQPPPYIAGAASSGTAATRRSPGGSGDSASRRGAALGGQPPPLPARPAETRAREVQTSARPSGSSFLPPDTTSATARVASDEHAADPPAYAPASAAAALPPSTTTTTTAGSMTRAPPALPPRRAPPPTRTSSVGPIRAHGLSPPELSDAPAGPPRYEA